MTVILETERMILRQFRLEDAADMYALNSDPDVLKYTGDPPFSSLEGARQFLVDYDQYKLNDFGRWAVIQKEGGDFMGWCGLKRHPEGFVDLGYRYFKRFWNQGFATEAACATLKIGFDHYSLSEIIGRVDERNIHSVRLLEQLGMEFYKKDCCNGVEGILFYRIRPAT